MTPAAGATPPRTPAPTRPPDLPSLTELIESARSVTYEQLLSRPERYVGDLVYFAGRVRAVTDDGSGRFQATINVGDGRELLIIYYAGSYFGHPLVEGDRVRFVGTFLGLVPNAAGEARPAVEIVDLLIRFT